MRTQQEIALGIGGRRPLKEWAVECMVCRLDEGIAGIRGPWNAPENAVTRSGAPSPGQGGDVFTTHAPVATGFDIEERGRAGFRGSGWPCTGPDAHPPSIEYFTPRNVPWHPGQLPLEANHILWYPGERHTVPARPREFG